MEQLDLIISYPEHIVEMLAISVPSQVRLLTFHYIDEGTFGVGSFDLLGSLYTEHILDSGKPCFIQFHRLPLNAST